MENRFSVSDTKMGTGFSLFSRSEFQVWCKQHPIGWLEHPMPYGSPIAEGTEGVIYEIEFDGHPRIAKIWFPERNLEGTISNRVYEVQILRFLSQKYPEMVPEIFGYFRVPDGSYMIVMEKLYPFEYSEESAERLFQYLDTLEAHGIKHGDISPNNLMEDAAGEPKLIDFSGRVQLAGDQFGTYFYSFRCTDRVSLARSLLHYKFRNLEEEIWSILEPIAEYSKFGHLCSDPQFFWFGSSLPETKMCEQICRGSDIVVEAEDEFLAWYDAFRFRRKCELGLEWIINRSLQDPQFPSDPNWFTQKNHRKHRFNLELREYMERISVEPNDFFRFLSTRFSDDLLIEAISD